MSGVNKAIIIGRLGQDPETRHTHSGATVANISVATSENWTDKQSGEKQERTEWHRVTFFGRLAEVASEYLRKGAQVYIEGRIQTDKYQAQDGTDRYSTKIIASQMQMLGGRSEKSTSPNQDRANTSKPETDDPNDPIPF